MTLIPEVHDGIARAVAARASRRRWWHPSRRAGLLATGGLVVGGTALAATGGWHPTLGSPDRGLPPRVATVGVPQEQLVALSILRRPQTEHDRGPMVERGLRVLDRRGIDGVHTDGIRVLFQTPREFAMVVPAERSGPAGFRHRDVLCLMSTSFSRAKAIPIRRHGKRRTIRLPSGFAGWGMTCGEMERLRTTGIATGTTPDPDSALIVNGVPRRPTIRQVVLVPDGVARVTVRLRHRRTVTVPVHDNVYRYTIHGFPAQMGTLWFDADGRRIDHRRRR